VAATQVLRAIEGDKEGAHEDDPGKRAQRAVNTRSSLLNMSCLSCSLQKVKQASERDFRYQSIMRNLVRRYVTVQQRRAESQGVTEDDVNEIKQDISAFRCELVEILKNSGMNTSTASGGAGGAGGKKNRQKERRLMKGFNVAPSIGSNSLTPVNENSGGFPLDHHGSHEFSALSGLFGPGITPRKQGQPNPNIQHQLSTSQSSFGESINPIHKLSRFAPKFHSKRNGGSHKRKWGNLTRFIALTLLTRRPTLLSRKTLNLRAESNCFGLCSR
jgi:transient receptor potential cation channel subfamily C member 4